MSPVTIEDVRQRLPVLLARVAAGEELVIVEDARPIARIVAATPNQPRPMFGRGRGQLTIVAEDDEHFHGFEEYQP